MKLINKKSFYLILFAILAYWAYQIINFITSIAAIDETLISMRSMYADLGLNIDEFKGAFIFGMAFGVLLSIGLSSIFFFKLLAHRKTPKAGSYLTVLMVFACIIGGINVISVITGSYLPIIIIAIVVLIIIGYSLQRKAPFAAPAYPPFTGFGAQNQPPYGQPPPPYGQPQQPYGQQYNNPYNNPYNNQPYQPGNNQPYQPNNNNPYGNQPYNPQPGQGNTDNNDK